MPKVERSFRPRILVLEDEGLIGIDLALTLQAQGYEVLGPCRKAAEVLESARRLHPDLAILDINLGDGTDSFKVAQMLQAAEIPLLFVSGYSEAVLPTPPGLRTARRLRKPVATKDLVDGIEALLDG